MKRKILYAFIISFVPVLLFSGAGKVLAIPAPRGIALNPTNKTCANYWAGDEFTSYHLPRGWESYYPEHLYYNTDISDNSSKNYVGGLESNRHLQEYISFKTKAGSCIIKQRDDNVSGDFSDCCAQLGYSFVQNVNYTTGDILVIVGTVALLAIVLVLGRVLFKKYRN
ncbi:MAG: hypothetical protein A3B07_02305 [Candidatus Yonathbacteria bacterium RIFCSPLOWO2_01_FULL_43_27]|nr:MAG: hypothetical protein A3B07_02305 [Candidatus Yonathbacteria bacterium RIFCSPLOWO2_01_FULL_43_27]